MQRIKRVKDEQKKGDELLQSGTQVEQDKGKIYVYEMRCLKSYKLLLENMELLQVLVAGLQIHGYMLFYLCLGGKMRECY